jgi:hypothetical protein
MGYLFGGDTGITQAQLNAERARLRRPQQYNTPVGRGVNDIARAFAARSLQGQEDERKAAAGQAFNSWAQGGYSGDVPDMEWLNPAQRQIVAKSMMDKMPLNPQEQLAQRAAQFQLSNAQRAAEWAAEDRKVAQAARAREKQLEDAIFGSLQSGEIPEGAAGSPVGGLIAEVADNPARQAALQAAFGANKGKGVASIMGDYEERVAELRDKTMSAVQKFQDRKEHKDYIDAAGRVRGIITLASQKNAAANYSLIASLVRTVDNSQVTGSEADAASRQGLTDSLQGMLQDVDGEGKLSDEYRQKIVNTATALMNSYNDAYMPRIERFRKNARTAGYDTEITDNFEFEPMLNTRAKEFIEAATIKGGGEFQPEPFDPSVDLPVTPADDLDAEVTTSGPVSVPQSGNPFMPELEQQMQDPSGETYHPDIVDWGPQELMRPQGGVDLPQFGGNQRPAPIPMPRGNPQAGYPVLGGFDQYGNPLKGR